MFKESIKLNSPFLVPFTEGIKYYGMEELAQGIGTMIILNENGDILTCRHIATRFMESDKLHKIFLEFNKELQKSKTKEEKEKVLKKYHVTDNTPILSKINIPFEGSHDIKIIFHKTLDIAIIRLSNLKLKLKNYPVFSDKLPEIGESICRLGYAFPEYDLFTYSKQDNDIIIKENPIINFPLFPLDGIVTRYVMDDKGNKTMFETSSIGIRGQSGCPIFTPDGTIYGIQSMTKQLDLDFDINGIVKRGLKKENINYTPFIGLGIGVSSKEIVKFLKENNIPFQSK